MNSDLIKHPQKTANLLSHHYFNIGIKDIFECLVMVLNYRSAEY